MLICAGLIPLTLVSVVHEVKADDRISYNRDIRPILSETCLKCHGPDSNRRKAALRLDVMDSAYGKGKSGEVTIVPGQPEQSQLIKRITASDEDEVMPPPAEQKALKPAEVELFRRWIKEGAHYEGHWAYQKIQKPAVVKPRGDGFPIRNPIDAFILDRLDKEGLKPSPEEERARLIRRVTLDLTGLPPSIAEVNQFLGDTSTDAYEKVVHRLLASAHFGERLATPWLDLARHSDTGGYHNDSFRTTWMWRDWVVKSFNDNKPFDQFTIEQLAGDLLPNATLDNKIASGFMRNVMTSDEGGIIPEEYLNLYIVDRIGTLGTTWLGLTVNCAQCHDHKYDPVTQKDFYSLYAFFHNVPELGKDGVRDRNPEPRMMVVSSERQQQINKLAADVTAAESKLQQVAAGIDARQKKWEQQIASQTEPAEVPGPLVKFPLETNGNGQTGTGEKIDAQARDGARFGPQNGRNAFETDGKGWLDYGGHFDLEKDQPFTVCANISVGSAGGSPFGKMDSSKNTRGWDVEFHGTKLSVHLIHTWPDKAIHVETENDLPANQFAHVAFSYDGSSKAAGVKVFVNGKAVKTRTQRDGLDGSIRTEVPFSIGRRGGSASPFHGRLNDFRLYQRTLTGGELATLGGSGILKIARLSADQRTPQQNEELRKFYRESVATDYVFAQRKIDDLKRDKANLEKDVPTTMVMAELEKPRDTFIKIRGQYDKDGDKVTAATPHFLPPLPVQPANGSRYTRLDLARWLVSPEQPLVARVEANRCWAMMFGTGLVKTVNDFGSQGDWPSHPELLEWLAADFRSDWDIKRCIFQMATSSTYRQSSRVTKEMLERDAENRLWAHGPRHRLDAEFVRDNALAVAGLLNGDIGGEPVFPAQPPGIWEINELSNGNWKQEHDASQYRRGLYVYHRRSTPYPSLLTFDAPSREVCVAIRARSSTPLQSLVMMNDPVFVEAARSLAQRVLKEPSPDASTRLETMWRLALARPMAASERKILERTLSLELARFHQNKADAQALTKVGDLMLPGDLDVSDLAAWTTVGSVILNLNETISN